MRLGGWHRLWLVLCCLYFVIVVGVSVVVFPVKTALSESTIRSGMSEDSRRQLAPIPDIGEEVTPPSGPPLRVSFEGRLILLQAGTPDSATAKVLEDYDASAVAALSSARWSFVAAAFAWWAVPCAAVYIVGRSIKWVLDGFRRANAV